MGTKPTTYALGDERATKALEALEKAAMYSDGSPWMRQQSDIVRAALCAPASGVNKLRIGVSANGQGAAVSVMQVHADGIVTVIYSEHHPAGESIGHAAIAAKP